jgi:hypothetical protein
VQASLRRSLVRCGGWVARQNRRGELALEPAHVPGELGKAQVNRSSNCLRRLAKSSWSRSRSRAKFAAQLLSGGIGQLRCRRPLLGSEPRDPQRIDRVGLGPLQLFPQQSAARATDSARPHSPSLSRHNNPGGVAYAYETGTAVPRRKAASWASLAIACWISWPACPDMALKARGMP